MASASFAFCSASVQFCALAAAFISLIALTSASFLVCSPPAAAEAVVGTETAERAAAATPNANAAEIARVVFQFIGVFLFRSDKAAAQPNLQTPPNPETQLGYGLCA